MYVYICTTCTCIYSFCADSRIWRRCWLWWSISLFSWSERQIWWVHVCTPTPTCTCTCTYTKGLYTQSNATMTVVFHGWDSNPRNWERNKYVPMVIAVLLYEYVHLLEVPNQWMRDSSYMYMCIGGSWSLNMQVCNIWKKKKSRQLSLECLRRLGNSSGSRHYCQPYLAEGTSV